MRKARGWDKGYNFGSREAVQLRWQAAINAGVNLIASDQYEDLSTFMKKQAATQSKPLSRPQRRSTTSMTGFFIVYAYASSASARS